MNKSFDENKINVCLECGSSSIEIGYPNGSGYCDDCDSENYITITKDLLETLYDFNGKEVDGFQIDGTLITVFLKDNISYYDKNLQVELCSNIDASFIQTKEFIKKLEIYITEKEKLNEN